MGEPALQFATERMENMYEERQGEQGYGMAASAEIL